jgi:hypothetical protein
MPHPVFQMNAQIFLPVNDQDTGFHGGTFSKSSVTIHTIE